MPQDRLRAVFMRGGTSKAIMFRQEDLPADRADWDEIFLAAMGTPDPYGRQLDGMGGGVSSLSKVCVVGPSSRPDADVDYTFVQLGVDRPVADYAANCGNMSSAVGPFAVDEGIVAQPVGPEAVVRIHNTNTGTIIRASFPMDGRYAAVDGELAIDGVAGTAAPVRLDFLSPGGKKTGRLLPTGNPVDVLNLNDTGGDVAATLVDAGNPCVFVAAGTVGLRGTELPDEIAGNLEAMDMLEAIRRAASVAMGLAGDLDEAAALVSIPKVAAISGPQDSLTLSGRTILGTEVDLTVRMISVGQPHRAIPVTGGLCVAVATRIDGSLPHLMASSNSGGQGISIAHASGTLKVDADIEMRNGEVTVESATIFRTARRLFEGNVLYRPSARAGRGSGALAGTVRS